MNLLIVLIAKYLLFVVILLSLLIILKSKRLEQKYLIKLMIVTLPLSYIIAKISSHFIYNPRPFVVDHLKPLFDHAADNGFPSDHTLLGMTIAAVVFVYNKKLGIFLGFLALSLGLARVLAQVHHLTDIVGSIVIAISATYISWRVTKKIRWFND